MSVTWARGLAPSILLIKDQSGIPPLPAIVTILIDFVRPDRSTMGARNLEDPIVHPVVPFRSREGAPAMPVSIFGYVWQTSGRHQIWLALLAIAIFLLTMGPLELQRRIVNSALGSGTIGRIVWLCAAYAALVLGAGGIKLGFNVYRGWISERAVRSLRRKVYDHAIECANCSDPAQEGIGMSIILAEAEPVGGFVGMCISEPLMQIGTLLTVFAYMLDLQPWMALFSIGLFSVQVFFIPYLQRAINRRAASRIRVLREVSGALIDDFAPGPTPADQQRAFAERVDRIFGLNMQIYWFKFTMNFLMNLTHQFGVISVLLVGGWYVLRHQLEVGTVVAFISGLKQVNEPWGDLVDYFREMTVSQVKYRLIAGVVEGPMPHASYIAAVAAESVSPGERVGATLG
jgi:ABC-type multidrug transport system fused ATPase/permease subunit